MEWIKKGLSSIDGNKLYIQNHESSAIFSEIKGDKDFKLKFNSDGATVFGICTPETSDFTGLIYNKNTQQSIYQINGLFYPGGTYQGITQWDKKTQVNFEYKHATKECFISFGNSVEKVVFSNISKNNFRIFFSSGSSYTSASILIKRSYLFQTNDSLYTIASDGALKNLGSVATADKMALFASDGFETLTKANCETIATQLGKCKILRAEF